MNNSGIVKLHGKEYQTVAKRIADFRANHPDYTVQTEIISNGDAVCVKATISNQNLILATGYAEEVRDSTNINKTSALENCETSAVGRALAFLGYGGSEIASANEVNDAIIAGAKKEVADYFKRYNKAVFDNIDSVYKILECAGNDDHEGLMGAAMDISEEDRFTVFGLAPTNGGILTTKARTMMKQSKSEAQNNAK